MQKLRPGFVLAACMALALAGRAHAREIEGVTLPERVNVGPSTLTLNGAGVRTKMWVKAYVGALYLKAPTSDANAVIAAEEPKRIVLVLLRDLSKDQMTSSFREAFEANAGPRMPALRDRMARFEGFLQSGHRGDWMAITYRPGHGVTVVNKAGNSIVIPGKDFADALFSVWLGSRPADSGLKKAMLSTRPTG